MSTMDQKTHVLPSFGRFDFFRIIAARKQVVQWLKTVDVLPKDFSCNARDEMVEEEDAFGECPARPPIEHYAVVALAVLPDG